MGAAGSGNNLYAYCGDNPTDATDPSGLKISSIKLVAKTFIDNIFTTGGVGTIPSPVWDPAVTQNALKPLRC